MIKGGPKIINDGLVLCLDAHDAKSYAGEPTTNNLDSSDRANANTGPDVSNNFGSIAITKEVVNYSSDRPHVYRFKSTNATGYVSIGYDSTIQNQSGSVYAFSFDYKVVRADSGTTTNLNTASFNVYGNGYKNPTSSNTSTNTTSSEVELSDGWKRVTKIYTCGYTGYNQTRQDLNTGGVGDFEVLIDNIQFEDKTYSTPFANLSRSATNGWVDRTTNNNDGTLVNGVNTGVSHYRDGQVIMPVANSYLDFDGSNQYVTISSLLNQETINGSTTKTIILWLNADSYGFLMPFSTGQNGANRIYYWTQSSLNTWRIGDYVSTTDHSTLPSAGTWFCTAIVINGLSVTGYLNGVQDYTGTYTAFTTQDFAVLGRHGNLTGTTTPYYYNGKIGRVLVYNKALTAAEVLSNYNATKGRFL